MKLIGKFIMFMCATCTLAVVYWYTPALMHSQSRLLNFLQLIVASMVVGISLIMLVGVLVMNRGKRSTLASPMPAPPKARSVPDPLTAEFNYIREQLRVASDCKSMYGVELSPDGRIEALLRAVQKLAAITEFNIGR